MKVVRMTEAGRHFLEARDFVLRNRSGEREKGASEKRRDDVHEEDLHDGHAWKDHGVADVRPVGGSELVRVGEDRRIATGARNDARHLVERHAEKEQAQGRGEFSPTSAFL